MKQIVIDFQKTPSPDNVRNIYVPELINKYLKANPKHTIAMIVSHLNRDVNEAALVVFNTNE